MTVTFRGDVTRLECQRNGWGRQVYVDYFYEHWKGEKKTKNSNVSSLIGTVIVLVQCFFFIRKLTSNS